MPITIPAQPFTFASESGNQPAAQLDSSFSNIRNALTGIALQASDLIGPRTIHGLVGANNAGTPNTKYDLSADLVVLRNPSGGLNVQTATGTLTNDTGLAGSAAGGRDQAGAFSANSWIHFYFIWSGSTLSTLSSTTAPPTGPALPTGYTHWAYAGAVRYNASPVLAPTRMMGAWAYYQGQQAVVTNGVATTETTVSVSSLVPPNALAFQLQTQFFIVFSTNSLKLRVISGTDYQATVTSASANVGLGFGTVIMPNISQQFFYLFGSAPSGADGLQVAVQGYKLPNGGE